MVRLIFDKGNAAYLHGYLRLTSAPLKIADLTRLRTQFRCGTLRAHVQFVGDCVGGAEPGAW
jgi:hypothetical protein